MSHVYRDPKHPNQLTFWDLTEPTTKSSPEPSACSLYHPDVARIDEEVRIDILTREEPDYTDFEVESDEVSDG